LRKLIGASLRLWASAMALCILTSLTQAARYQELVLHAFTGQSDGWLPNQALIRDAQGNLYGSTAFGGNYTGLCDSGYISGGCGVIFSRTITGNFNVLHTFDFSDGANPTLAAQDADGNLYGSTTGGGNSACQYGGCGVIFKLTPAGDFTVLYNFTGGPDGANPNSLIMDDQGNFYGTTSGSNTGFEEIFELTNSGRLQVLYVFSQPGQGSIPNGLVRDGAGNLYGTTFQGGDYGSGTVFKIDAAGSLTVLYSFMGESDGGFPVAPPVMDQAGNLYGTASQNGYRKGKCHSPDPTQGCGTVFKIDTAGTFSVLFAFREVNGQYPGPLSKDAKGVIYGTTARGGNHCSPGGCGVAFKLNSKNRESVLFDFPGREDGAWPGKLVGDSKRNQYGTSAFGGDMACSHQSGQGCGLIFELIR